MTGNWPPEVEAAVAEAVAAHRDDARAATDAAVAAVKRLDCYPKLAARLVRAGVQTLVYDRRHQANRQMRREVYGAGGRDTEGGRSAVGAGYESLYDYMIAGMTLGGMTPKLLAETAAAEAERAAGNHPDWPKGRCHRHAMLIMTKKLLVELWCVWNGIRFEPDRKMSGLQEAIDRYT